MTEKEETMMEEKRMAQLDPRLERVADFVRPGALFADVGCDHGHLSVELMRRGAQRGFACDIKEGPLQAAKRNLEKAGFAERVQTVRTDGLAGMEQSGVTDVVIAGIGGGYQRDFGARSFFTAGGNPSSAATADKRAGPAGFSGKQRICCDRRRGGIFREISLCGHGGRIHRLLPQPFFDGKILRKADRQLHTAGV